MSGQELLALAERDREVLIDLEFTNDLSSCPLDWCRPLDIGGCNGSDHSYRLSKLARMGLVDQQQRSAHMSRGSKVYRINDRGRAAIAHATESRQP